jgi:hypothetical protein
MPLTNKRRIAAAAMGAGTKNFLNPRTMGARRRLRIRARQIGKNIDLARDRTKIATYRKMPVRAIERILIAPLNRSASCRISGDWIQDRWPDGALERLAPDMVDVRP